MVGRIKGLARHAGGLITVTAAIWVCTSQAAPAPAADPLLENQWHLKARTTEVGGANVRAAWPITQGDGVIVGIVDDGLQWAHPDLSPNYRSWASWDFNYNDADPQPFSTVAHGTAVTGVAGARGDNGIGVSGVAPLVALAGVRLTALPTSDAQEAAAFGHLPDLIDIFNNSWGPSDNGLTVDAPGPLASAARELAATKGRYGKGRVFVWSAGDGRLSSDDCNFDGYANSRFVIAVGASTDAGAQAPYSEGCSALMVVAPSSGGTRSVTTTDLMASPGYDPSDYTAAFTGTSGSAPVVTGAVALMLARNPSLTWRDVQYILRRTSVRILPTDLGWTTGPYPHNERVGFGLLDTDAAVKLAGGWTNVPAEEVLAPAARILNRAIPDVNATGVNDTITIASSESNFVIEHVEVDFSATHTWRGDLLVTLTSPSGVVSRLVPLRGNDGNNDYKNIPLGSVRHWGEAAAGQWTLTVSDRRFNDVGTWDRWALRLYGYHGAQPAPGAFAKSSPSRGATAQPASLTLNWTPSSGAAGYEYCIDASNDNACTGWTSTGANTSVALSGLTAGAQYFWQVRATNAAGITYADSSATTFWDFSVAVPLPGAFSHRSPANGALRQTLSPLISWGDSAGASAYEYCVDAVRNNSCDGVWANAGLSTSVTLGGLSNGTVYEWKVRANNAGGVTYAGGSTGGFWWLMTKPKARPAVDLNGDGNGDVFTYHPQSGAWARQVSLSGGGFSTTTGTWSPGWTVIPVNFNTDALTDFFLFNAVSGQWFKMINTGTGFSTQATSSWWQGWDRFVMDLNGDGVSDLFLYDPTTGQWFKCISTPDGFDYIQGGWNPGWEIYPMSFNNDAFGDMFLIDRATGRWFWVLGEPGGGFSYPVTEVWFPGWMFYPGDFNGDSRTDVLLHDPATGTYFVATTSESGFTYQQGGWSVGWTPWVADLDADGGEDLFLHDPKTGVWFQMISSGAGGFHNGGGETWSLGWQLHPTDLNGDGRTDLVLYDPATGVWYQARNLVLGSFNFSSGVWATGLDVIVRPPIR